MLSSLNENAQNHLEIVEVDLEQGAVKKKDLLNIRYPASKVMWSPLAPSYGQEGQLLAVTSDKLRLYAYSDAKGVALKSELKNTLLNDLSAPLTSFDWSRDKNYIVCSSIDTTCSIFDIKEEKFYKQLIAHDKEVGSDQTFDVSFNEDGNLFVTVGGDNTLRQFDIRDLSKSDILHDRDTDDPFIRVAWNQRNPTQIAMISLYSPSIFIYDVRNTYTKLKELNYHKDRVNNIAWSPEINSSKWGLTADNYLCSIGEQNKAFIWDLNGVNLTNEASEQINKNPHLEYNSQEEIVNVAWTNRSWIRNASKNKVQLMKFTN